MNKHDRYWRNANKQDGDDRAAWDAYIAIVSIFILVWLFLGAPT
jgi:hypothetical protein